MTCLGFSGPSGSNSGTQVLLEGACVMKSTARFPGRPDEITLVTGLAQQDERALQALIASYGDHVYGKALQILGVPELAEEVTQDTLLVLWWSPGRFDGSKGNLRSFLMGVVRHKAIDAVRRQEVIRSKESLLSDAQNFAEASPSNEVEDAIVVRAALSKLPQAKREVLFLAYYRGLTYREVARVLNLSEGTVKTRIRDSLIKLKNTIPSSVTN